MRIGIVGCGKIFPMHAYSIKKIENIQLSAIADTNTEKLEHWANKLNVNKYQDYKEMIDKEALDVLHICTPHYLHKEMAVYALKKGLHVLTEKPSAIHYLDAIEMLEAKKNNNRALVVSFQNRFNESSVLVKEEFKKGVFGDFLGGKAQLTWNRSEDYYLKSGWKGLWTKEGGGLIIDQAIHTLDLVTWILDSNPKVVHSILENLAHPTIEVEDTAHVVLEYFVNKFFVFSGNNFYVEDSPVIIELLFERAKVIFTGDQVKIDCDCGKKVIQDPDISEMFNFEGHKQYWGTSHLKEIKNFYNELFKGNFSPKNSIEECMMTQKLVDNIYKDAIFSSGKRR